jgi:hypothetical protein
MSLPRVVLDPRYEPCLSVIRWDAESMVLSVSLLMNARKDRSVADQLDAQLGILAPHGRIAIGDLDVLVDAESRLTSMEIRTNPGAWKAEAIEAPQATPAPASMRFLVAFDENQIASYDVTLQISQDHARQIVRLDLGRGAPSKWGSLASDVVVGLTVDGYLTQVRLVNFAVATTA